jgi:hypothetical protein
VYDAALVPNRSCTILQTYRYSIKETSMDNTSSNHPTYVLEASKQFILKYKNPKDFH